MTSYRLPKISSGSEATEILIGAITLERRSHWTGVPPLFRSGRAKHLAGKLTAYRGWHERALGWLPSALHLTLATELMLRFQQEDFRERRSMNPWLLDGEFPHLWKRI